MNPTLNLILLCLLVNSVNGSVVMAAQQVPEFQESQIKAVYLFRFTSFIEWPAGLFPMGKSGTLRICIAGENRFGEALSAAVKGEFHEGRPITIHYLHSANSLDNCQILYLSDSLSFSEEKKLINNQQGKPILTISDRPDFIKRGGMIEFYSVNHKVRFIIAPRAIRRAGIWVSANLLRVGDVVE